MSLSLSFLRKAVLRCSLASILFAAQFAQADFARSGAEYNIGGALPTDQVHPRLAINHNGGYLVWEDTLSDVQGVGIGAIRLDSGSSAVLSPIKVNNVTDEDQERPDVALLDNGGAVFVWQGGKLGFQHIFARIIAPDGTWSTSDIRVSASDSTAQVNARVAKLADGNLVVVYSSFNQVSGASMQDVYGQLLSPAGEKIGGEFLVNQFTAYNQRTPVVAALASGGFAVVWISEQQRTHGSDNPNPNFIYGSFTQPSVDVVLRKFGPTGLPLATEQLVNTSTRICANPTIAASDSGYAIVWGEREMVNRSENWDVYARTFPATGSPSAVKRVNTFILGPQIDSEVTCVGDKYMVVWSSYGQDGFQEGVYGQLVKADGSLQGEETRVNTTTASKQMHQAVASDGNGRVVAAWTSYVGGARSFDLFAQRFAETAAQPLTAIDKIYTFVPFTLTAGVYTPEIQVSWAAQAGLEIDHYEVYVNGSATAVVSVTESEWLMSASHGLTTGAQVSFRVAFVTKDGRKSPLSAPVTAKAWSGYNWGGVPFEWMTSMYGADVASWPAAATELAPNGPTVLQVFLSGGNPTTPSSWLRTQLVTTDKGIVLQWNPQPGLIYQVQTSTTLSEWDNVGGKRLATGTQDELNVGSGNCGYYRVMLLR